MAGRGIRVYAKTHLLTVQTVVSWANEGFVWELMAIRNTTDWRMFIQCASERAWPLAMLVQIHEKAPATVDGEDFEGIPSAAIEEEDGNQAAHVTESEAQGQAD